jgi:3',5'-cyclic AMP phosphodiesterase CpdA
VALIAQISDTHFGADVPHVVEALVALLRGVAPDLLVLSGDLTQRARPREFAAARAFVRRLATPHALVLPGNHDIPLFDLARRAFAPYGRFSACFGAELEPSFESDELLVLGVNTTRRWLHIDGRVSGAQVDRVCARLRRARPGQLRVVVTHQPVYVSRPQDRKDLLGGHERALPAWCAAGADVVLGGHIHLPQVHVMRERRADLPRAMWCVQAGTATSSRVRWEAPNSVNLLRYEAPAAPGDAPRCTAERWDHAAADGRFVQVETHAMRLDRSAPGGGRNP